MKQKNQRRRKPNIRINPRMRIICITRRKLQGKQRKIVYRRISNLEHIVSYKTYNSRRILEVKQKSFNTIVLVF